MIAQFFVRNTDVVSASWKHISPFVAFFGGPGHSFRLGFLISIVSLWSHTQGIPRSQVCRELLGDVSQNLEKSSNRIDIFSIRSRFFTMDVNAPLLKKSTLQTCLMFVSQNDSEIHHFKILKGQFSHILPPVVCPKPEIVWKPIF